jgi:hypothetical protein
LPTESVSIGILNDRGAIFIGGIPAVQTHDRGDVPVFRIQPHQTARSVMFADHHGASAP